MAVSFHHPDPPSQLMNPTRPSAKSDRESSHACHKQTQKSTVHMLKAPRAIRSLVIVWCLTIDYQAGLAKYDFGRVLGQKPLKTASGHRRGGAPTAMLEEPRQDKPGRAGGVASGRGAGLLVWLVPFHHGEGSFRPWPIVVNRVCGWASALKGRSCGRPRWQGGCSKTRRHPCLRPERGWAHTRHRAMPPAAAKSHALWPGDSLGRCRSLHGECSSRRVGQCADPPVPGATLANGPRPVPGRSSHDAPSFGGVPTRPSSQRAATGDRSRSVGAPLGRTGLHHRGRPRTREVRREEGRQKNEGQKNGAKATGRSHLPIFLSLVFLSCFPSLSVPRTITPGPGAP